jgi:hypothetical protein
MSINNTKWKAECIGSEGYQIRREHFEIPLEEKKAHLREYLTPIVEVMGGSFEVQKTNSKLIVEAVNACKEVNQDNPQAVAESIKDMYEALKSISVINCDTCHGTGYIGEDFGCPDCSAYGKVIKYTNPIDIETLIEVIAKAERR